MAQPLAGVRVLEHGTFITGPAAAMLLADLGADVVKVEQPAGDPFRAFRGGTYSPHYQTYNRNKKSVTLDTRTPDDLALREQAERQFDRASALLEALRAVAKTEPAMGTAEAVRSMHATGARHHAAQPQFPGTLGIHGADAIRTLEEACRVARARGHIRMAPATFELIARGKLPVDITDPDDPDTVLYPIGTGLRK